MGKAPLVVLSGGIGSGKSTVALMWRELGACVIDADAIVHELQAPGAPLLAVIRGAFGDEVFDRDGDLDRKALGAVVFADPHARQRLGAIVHPEVRREMKVRTERAFESNAMIVVHDIPLYFEGRARDDATARPDYAASVLVWVPVALQIARVVARDACSEDEACQRVAAQMPIDEKRDLADYVIDNSGSLDDTRRQLKALHETLLA